MIAGLDHVRVLPTSQQQNYALDPQTLSSAMQVGDHTLCMGFPFETSRGPSITAVYLNPQSESLQES